MKHLLIFGLGTCGAAVARAALAAGMKVSATSRKPGQRIAPGVRVVAFGEAGGAIFEATHVLSTVPSTEGTDPVLARYAAILRDKELEWLGYLSTTGVYGDRDGGWVEESTPTAPVTERGRRRVAAERGFGDVANGRPFDIFRLAGIYGPGRSPLDDVRSGRARRIVRPGHAFGRIHVEDIAGGVMAAIARPPEGTRVLNFSDDEPAESAAVLEEAARLLGVAPPPEVTYEDALEGMTPMGRSFWSENRRVASRRTQEMLARAWTYPTFREGLRAILEQERERGLPQ